jgi:hypothetical protein
LPGGGQATFDVVVRVGSRAANPLVTGAEVTASTPDDDLANNTASIETEVKYNLFLPVVYKADGG